MGLLREPVTSEADVLFLKRLFLGLLGAAGAGILAVIAALVWVRLGAEVNPYSIIGMLLGLLIAMVVGFVKGWRAAGGKGGQP